jgi:hypothetical protein
MFPHMDKYSDYIMPNVTIKYLLLYKYCLYKGLIDSNESKTAEGSVCENKKFEDKKICTHMRREIMYFINHVDLQNT